MPEEKKRLIEKARKMYKEIYPCGKGKTFSECFTENDDHLVLWFNTEDDSTHIVKEIVNA